MRRRRLLSRSLAVLFSLAVTTTSVASAGQVPRLADYLQVAGPYDPDVPTPRSVLGFEVGEWHVRHDLLVRYMEALAEASDRVTIRVTGHTHEQRPLLLLTITSPANHARLGALQDEHLALSDPGRSAPATDDMPVVLYLGYSVHGDEASGANAALAVAYRLAAARDQATLDWLDNAVILLDPSLNPDGLGRFAQWVNGHKGKVLVADSASREHNQGWPSGRTNHYWFDLNRDWLLAQHPESQARLESFHAWRPNVLTDHHEMGTNSTYFFQPGVASRRNPLTPERNVELTAAIAAYHARALDQQGRYYYSDETFDDFYYGKGSTYPDVHGAVGILFEQASARGHLQESVHGDLSFPFAVQNQVTTSFTTVQAAVDNRQALLDYQRDFYRQASAVAAEDPAAAYVFGDAHDVRRVESLVELLRRHRIEVHPLTRALTVGGDTYTPGRAYLVPLDQRQVRLVKAVFEQPITFPDETFYDVSAWTLPLAFGLASATVDAAALGDHAGEPVTTAPATTGRAVGGAVTVAYAFDWHGYYAPRALYRLLDAGAKARLATREFTAQTDAGARAFAPGTIVVPVGLHDEATRGAIDALLPVIAEQDGVDVFALASGLTPEGIDLGSPSLLPLHTPQVALVVGRGTSAYEAGEAWHLLDHRFGVPVTLLERRALTRADLDRYSHVILVGGRYHDLGKDATEALTSWLRQGGVLVATKDAAIWSQSLAGPAGDDDRRGNGTHGNGDEEPTERIPWAERSARFAEQLVSGAIFEVDLDTTHPLAYGYHRDRLPVFRNSTLQLEPSEDPYATVAQYTSSPRLAGFVGDDNLDALRDTPAVIAERVGRGVLVRMVDNPNFRAFWYGTSKLFLNPLFFGHAVASGGR